MFFFLVAVGAGTVVLCIIVIIGLCCYVKRVKNLFEKNHYYICLF